MTTGVTRKRVPVCYPFRAPVQPHEPEKPLITKLMERIRELAAEETDVTYCREFFARRRLFEAIRAVEFAQPIRRANLLRKIFGDEPMPGVVFRPGELAMILEGVDTLIPCKVLEVHGNRVTVKVTADREEEGYTKGQEIKLRQHSVIPRTCVAKINGQTVINPQFVWIPAGV